MDGNNKPKAAVIAGADRILSFFTATIVEMAEKKLDDPQLRALYPFLLEGLRKSVEGVEEGKSGGKIISRIGGPSDQWRRSSCMIIAQICRKTRLAKPLLKNIIGALMYSFVHISGVSNGVTSVLDTQSSNTSLDAAIEIVTIVSVIAQSQKINMGPKMLMAVFADISECSNSSINSSESQENIPTARIGSAYLLQCIEILQKEKGFDASALLKAMTTTLTGALVYVGDETKNYPESSFLSPMMASKILSYCISSGMLVDSIIGAIVWKILQNNSLLSNIGQVKALPINVRKGRSESFSDDNDGDRKEVLRVLRCVSQRYPSIFDTCVQAAYNDVKSDVNDILDGDEDLEPTLESIEIDDKDDENENEEELQIGQTLSEINLEKQAKASSLRKLLCDKIGRASCRERV